MASIAAQQLKRGPKLSAEYDRLVDVLHLTCSRRGAVEGEGLPDGVELVYAVTDGTPAGVTVVGFKRNGWEQRPADLAKIAGKHLGVRSGEILRLIASALR